MGANPFQKATKAKANARIGMSGPSGSGKTYTALEWAEVFAASDDSRIAFIDTERDSASLYADRFDFDTLNITKPYHPNRLMEALTQAEQAGYKVVVIDSGSHFWSGPGGVLEIVDAAKGKFGGNSHMAWGVGTPLQQAMVDALLAYPGHVIFTMRSKSEWLKGEDSRGRQTMTKVGTSPQQRDGIEYEFTLMLDVDLQHRSYVGKTRCADIAESVFGPGDGRGAAEQFLGWLRSGANVERTELTPGERDEIHSRIAQLPSPVKGLMRNDWTNAGLPGPADMKVEHLAEARKLLDLAETAAADPPDTPAAEPQQDVA